jgi:hypothetical protein
VRNGHERFRCPFCFEKQTITGEDNWRQHAFADLKAYVCTLGKGECDNRLFRDKQSWFEHELQCHRKQWVCILCDQSTFTTPGQLDAHLEAQHPEIPIRGNQVSVFQNACERAVSTITASECPFCDELEAPRRILNLRSKSKDPSNNLVVKPDLFRDHVASHLEQVALIILVKELRTDMDQEDVSTRLGVEAPIVNTSSTPSTSRVSTDHARSQSPRPIIRANYSARSITVWYCVSGYLYLFVSASLPLKV